MGRRLVMGDLRVQEIPRASGRWSYTILWPEGSLHREADRFLRTHEGSGTQRTYAYLLVDHLRWLEREALELEAVTLRDLERYMGIRGAAVWMPLGEPWRAERQPLSGGTLSVLASCLKGFYLHQAGFGVNEELGRRLDKTRLPSQADRGRMLLGHAAQSLPANPLAPRRVRRRHPKLLPEGARDRLLGEVHTARDRMVVTWLADGGFRIGELCSFHLVDLHLRERAACGDLRAPHAHVCHREGNQNRARVKVKYPWDHGDGIVRGGLIKRVSPAMIHT
ncbi:hypothetical protein AB0H37_43780 [Actinomadura sp. NPDC023710]|uniref:hypothetical protein n=1 Tax=Actinomadura sp. NPDC023710 TaxID=3158219 RepID=UPI003400986D